MWPGELERNAGGFGNVRVVGRVSQKNAGAVAINADALEHGGKMRVLRGVTVRDTDDLEAVRFDFLVGEDTDTGGFDGAEVFGVVAELFVIASDEVDAVRGGEAAERFGGAVGVDGCAVIQSPAIKIASGSSLRILATMRCRKLLLRTWPRWTSLMRAALRPRHASGRLARRTVMRVMRVQLALKTP